MSSQFVETLCQKNIESLSANHPELVEKLTARLADGVINADLEAETGPKNTLTLKARDASGVYRLHSAYDPVREARATVADFLRGGPSEAVPVIVGFGLGFLIEEDLASARERRVIVVEPSIERFILALGLRDFSAIFSDPRLALVVGFDATDAAAETAVVLSERQVYNWKPWLTQPMARLNVTFSKAFFRELSTVLTTLQTRARTRYQTSKTFLDNAISNLPAMWQAPGVNDLAAAWSRKPLVLVSAGPSLDKHLEQLRAINGKMLIVAVGQAWRPLRAVGIVPDFVVAVDPNAANLPHFETLEPSKEWLVADAACHPDIVEKFGRRVVFGHATPDKEKLFAAICGPRGEIQSGGSVANSALSFVITLQASPVIIVGQDLAFTGGKSHADNNAYSKQLAETFQNAKGMRPVSGYFGDTVYTNAQMDTYRVWFEGKAAEHGELRLINCTEGGARIAGLEQMPLSDALAQFSGAESAQDSSLCDRLRNAPVISHAKLERNVARLTVRLERVASFAEKAAVVCAKLSKPQAQAQRARLGGQLSVARGKLNPDDELVWTVLGAYLSKASFHLKHQAQIQERDAPEGFFPVAGKYYQETAAAAHHATAQLRDALKVCRQLSAGQVEARSSTQ